MQAWELAAKMSSTCMLSAVIKVLEKALKAEQAYSRELSWMKPKYCVHPLKEGATRAEVLDWVFAIR